MVVGEAWQAGPGDHVLAAPPARFGEHPAGCACCRPRPALGQALGAAFLASVRAGVTPPARVLVTGSGAEAVAAALAADVLAGARFRFDGTA